MIALWGLPKEGLVRGENEPLSDLAPASGSHSGSNTLLGGPAPNFQLRDLDGKLHELREYRGEVVLLNFWATWCAPCRLEMPLLDRQSQEFADRGLVILAVNLQETAAQIEDFVNETGILLPILLDTDGAISEAYRIMGYPSSVIVDPSGLIQVIHVGIITEPQLHEYLQQVGLDL